VTLPILHLELVALGFVAAWGIVSIVARLVSRRLG
jgi:hypothetical protein